MNLLKKSGLHDKKLKSYYGWTLSPENHCHICLILVCYKKNKGNVVERPFRQRKIYGCYPPRLQRATPPQGESRSPLSFSYLRSRTAKPSTKTKWRTSDFASVSKQNGRSNRTAPQQILVEFSNQAATFFTPFDLDHFMLLCIATPMLIFQEANEWDLAWFAS